MPRLESPVSLLATSAFTFHRALLGSDAYSFSFSTSISWITVGSFLRDRLHRGRRSAGYLDKATQAGGKMVIPVTYVADGVIITMFTYQEGNSIGLNHSESLWRPSS